MTPFKLAWKITQFIFWITLFLVVTPTALFYGSIYGVTKYEAWQEYRHMPYCEFTLPPGVTADGSIGYDNGHPCKVKP